jgi:hypothetical protein
MYAIISLMNDPSELIEKLNLQRPEACDGCVSECEALNVGSEAHLCLLAVQHHRSGPIRSIGDRDLREIIMFAGQHARSTEKLQAVFFALEEPTTTTQA